VKEEKRREEEKIAQATDANLAPAARDETFNEKLLRARTEPQPGGRERAALWSAPKTSAAKPTGVDTKSPARYNTRSSDIQRSRLYAVIEEAQRRQNGEKDT